MIFIKYNGISGKVEMVHYQPFDETNGLGKTEAELEQEGLLVESIPEPQTIEGKSPLLKVNITTKEPYYEYIDNPPTPEDEIAQLKQKQELMQQAIDDLILGGAL